MRAFRGICKTGKKRARYHRMVYLMAEAYVREIDQGQMGNDEEGTTTIGTCSPLRPLGPEGGGRGGLSTCNVQLRSKPRGAREPENFQRRGLILSCPLVTGPVLVLAERVWR